ncbi:hypothetical protein WN55_01663 [Dufourea novaeangliae]|uniref:Uncharacterized protein n=1 Tax=Dufourea novaeangliae TaxID=178035 RepID=A0A154PGJ2_DUFNO|nr:hypothetical protein WN55_01663 [Dufourea novaeangliae]
MPLEAIIDIAVDGNQTHLQLNVVILPIYIFSCTLLIVSPRMSSNGDPARSNQSKNHANGRSTITR